MRISLAMIIRDGEETIAACLESAKPFISSWTIIDTGSTDRTMEIIRETLDGIPGSLLEREWVNFAHNRSELLLHAKRENADYLMMLDDDLIVHLDAMPDVLTADVYEGRFQGSLDYALPILIRNDREWAYRGVAHSYLACTDGKPVVEETLPGLEIEDHSHVTVEKLERDLVVLRDEHALHPLDARTAFYLARTYDDLDRFPEAMQTYRLRAGLDGWIEETFYAKYRLGCLLGEHVSFSEGARELLAAWELFPTRIEPLRVLANLANSVADKYPYPEAGGLFVVRRHYATPAPAIDPSKVSAVIVTRGNVDLAPILETLPYPEVVIWNNAERERDLKTYGRYVAFGEVSNDVVYTQDDDVIFTAHDELLAAWEPGKVVTNMDRPWIEACGYDDMIMTGAGSLIPRELPGELFPRYLSVHPEDDEFLIESDFVFGTLAWPLSKVVDLGYEARSFSDDADRLYTQPWQPALKRKVRDQALAVRDGDPFSIELERPYRIEAA